MKEQFKTMHGNVYETPRWLFDKLNKEFNFTVDLACNAKNSKCKIGLSHPETDSLQQDWNKFEGFLWLNPPYSPIKPWILKAQETFINGGRLVLLVPAVIFSTRYFASVTPSEVRFILGRVPFSREGGTVGSNTHDSMIVIYNRPVISKIAHIERDSFK